MQKPEPLLVARGIRVCFGATTALDDVAIDLRAGEVHAVVGENGAGKSTLVGVLAGAVHAQTGTVAVRPDTRLAWAPQDPLLPADLTAEQWIFLGRELCGPLGWLRPRRMQAAAEAALRLVGCSVTPLARLGTLPSPQRKQVQLARAISAAPHVLLLDEPTAVLGDSESRDLFAVIQTLKQRNAGILYVSHRLDEVLAIADRVTVLRDGRHVSTDPVGNVDTATLIQRMVGRALRPQQPSRRHVDGQVRLELCDLAVAHVRGLSLTVRAGEVVGLAGLMGAGRSEVIEGIAGLCAVHAGRITTSTRSVLVPEDRATKGLVPTLGLRENLFLPAEAWRLAAKRERRAAQRWIEQLRIRSNGTEAPINSLSGGNQQKLLLARALRQQPGLLLLDEPTAGVDVGAKAEIHELIRQLAAAGTAILLASSDLLELLALCDRVVALREGRVMGSLPAEEADEPRLAALITGAEQSTVEGQTIEGQHPV